jgi:hypothetical protein
LLANRFRAAGKVCYTFYNTSGREITGGIVEDPGMGDCRLVELIRDEEVDSPQAVRVPAGAVAVLGCFRKLLNVKRADGALTISVPAGSGDKVIICENRDDCHFHQPRSKRVELPLENGSCRYTLRGNGKVIIKLMKDGYQVDQVVIK